MCAATYLGRLEWGGHSVGHTERVQVALRHAASKLLRRATGGESTRGHSWAGVSLLPAAVLLSRNTRLAKDTSVGGWRSSELEVRARANVWGRSAPSRHMRRKATRFQHLLAQWPPRRDLERERGETFGMAVFVLVCSLPSDF